MYLHNYYVFICDWLWENLPLMHKDKYRYVEKCNCTVQSKYIQIV